MVSINTGEILKSIETKYMQKKITDFQVGDTVKMKIKVAEADKIRLHPFEGLVIRKTGRGFRATFTVRKMSFGEGVERTFPLYSPTIESLVVFARGEAKRARLYYLRGKTGKEGRLKTRQA